MARETYCCMQVALAARITRTRRERRRSPERNTIWQGLGCRVWGLGFGVLGSGFRV